jgi:pimeloyl-ACP methyl ester carboxylesterase
MNATYKSPEGARAVAERYREFLAQWPTPNQQLRLPTRQGETFVIACGREEAPALLLFHGSGANSAFWLGDVPAFAQHFRVYAVDMIGEPGLSAPVRPPLDSEAHALWLDDVLKALGVERAAIAGISLGGWLALDYATRRPGRVDALALVCPGGVGRQKNFLLKAFPLLFLGAWGQRKLRALVFGDALPTDTAEARAVGDFVDLIFKHFRPRIDKLPAMNDEALKALRIPVLAIVGGKDVLLDSADTKKRLESNVAGAEVVFLPEAGHVLINQTQRLLDFLLRAQASRQGMKKAS